MARVVIVFIVSVVLIAADCRAARPAVFAVAIRFVLALSITKPLLTILYNAAIETAIEQCDDPDQTGDENENRRDGFTSGAGLTRPGHFS
jgi:hypothetical protein